VSQITKVPQHYRPLNRFVATLLITLKIFWTCIMLLNSYTPTGCILQVHV